ncbi:hypothetical protein LTR85_007695 [Meristemomyces frigidus]|nr:hypothetical protein LTR85_007695 [Meristemomyces frigidus]
MAPKLEYTFTLRAYLDKDGMLGIGTVMGGPQRTVANVTRGWMEGPGLERCDIVAPTGDWLQIDPSTGSVHLDVRGHVRTKDGYAICTYYHGLMVMDPKATKVMTFADDAKTTELGDHDFFTAPRFETSDPKLKWIENASFVGEGRFVVDEDGSTAVDYAIYRLLPGKQ